MKTKAIFGHVTLYTDTVARGFDKRPLCGVTFDVVSGSAARSRMSATRVVTGTAVLGPVGTILGGLSRKHSGGECWLVVSGPNFEWREKVDPKHVDRAQRFVARANTQVSSQNCAETA